MKRKIALFLIFLLLIPNGMGNSHLKKVTIDVPTKMGEYATGGTSGEYLDDKELEWLSKFEIVHAGSIEEPLLPQDMEYLREKGVKTILADDWLPAAYYYPGGNNTSFMEWVYEHRYDVTLNPEGPFPHCQENGYDWREYYFDFSVEELVAHRVEYLAEGLRNAGYNGIFFDWGNGLFLQEKGYESINATYNSRHSIPYSQAAADFLAALREEMPEIVIENNQGFREAKYYLPVLDYDMTESYITGCDYYGKELYVEGYGLIEVPQTVYYPVSDDEFHGSLNDTIHYLDYLSELRKAYGGENFKKTVYMNYAAPEFVFVRREGGHDVYKPVIPKNAIYFGYAVAKLAGQISYTEVPWNHTYERCNVYFYDIGEPLDDDYEKINGGYVRYYSNGFVVAGEWQDEKELTLHSPYIPSHIPVYDAFEEKWIDTGEQEVTITIHPCYDNLTGKMAPSGRIYVYASGSLEVKITKPEAGKIYFMDREVMPFARDKAIVIGKITVEVESNGNRVEFYVDNELKSTDESMPYKWLWNERTMGKHEVRVVAYGDGSKAEDKINVWKIF